MKRILSLVLVFAMLTLVAGCSCSEKKAEQETTTIAWQKGESLFGSKLREYATACQRNDKKGIKANRIYVF